ncbi:MAG: redoxin domain-containing protein [Planctomycetia bacterium]|nr:redoxin domain-containing protein [Planctomycetia bacterium]
MVPTLYLFACALAIGQPTPADAPEWQLQPRLSRGQELVYRGRYTEENTSQGVQFVRGYDLEARFFALEVTRPGVDLAALTVWKGRSSGDEKAGQDINSVRLELGRVDDKGRMTSNRGGVWSVPLDGPPAVECGAFVEVPHVRVGQEQTWDAHDAGRPPLTWRVVGVEQVNTTRCVKLIGTQQSDDWDAPRADRTAWRRRDTVWIAPHAGFASKVERIIERREPARREPGQRLVVKYELESSLQYPGRLYEDRRLEIQTIQTVRDKVTALLPKAHEVGAGAFDAALTQLRRHTESVPPTPYRDALRNVQRLAEAGKRGETPPDGDVEESSPAPRVIGLGKPAPDFLTTDLTNRQSTRLRRWIGQPILLVFYNPTTELGVEVLRFAQKISEANPNSVTVIGLACSDDSDRVLQQRERLKLDFPILSGSGLKLSYAVETTPKLIVLDAAGIVQGSYLGWGPETPANVTDDLERCKAAKK